MEKQFDDKTKKNQEKFDEELKKQLSDLKKILGNKSRAEESNLYQHEDDER